MLGPMTTLEVGGPARYFVTCRAEAEIVDALEFARKSDLQVFILGGGSNVVVSDDGFDGLVIEIAVDRSTDRTSMKHFVENGIVTAGAGESWDDVVKFCVENGLAGVECLSGIPGSVGGTPVQNVGAYGQEVSETIDSVGAIDTTTLEPVRLSASECGFAYRQSIFNTSERGRYVIYDVSFRLTPGGRPKIVYRDLIEHFADRRPSLGETRDAVISIRRSKSMVIEAMDENRRSVGSFFKNPVVGREILDRIAAEFDANVPHFAAAADLVKIPAAWLIENAGFYKGYRKGNAGISSRHSLAIVNLGGANAREILELKDEIQKTVREKFDIELLPEPVFIGGFQAKK